MPHKCVECGNIYPDGSEEILSGCSDCGERKFEFISVEDAKTIRDAQSTEPTEHASSTSTDDDKDDSGTEVLDDAIIIDDGPTENETQQQARSEIVSDSDLPKTESAPSSLGNTKTDLDEVKEHLHEQFEGIRIVEPGQYQLNLMKLYEKKDCVISLQEDGRYIINVPGLMETEPADDE